jgi:pimeloyl-ACP methyl ester carboxylesterase
MHLFCRIEGSGNPLVIIHGLYGSSDNWLTVAKKLASEYQVFSVDLRNHGRSPHSDVHDYEAMTNDLAGFFDEHRIEKAILLGHSMGGKVAMSYAANYPERIEKLIVVDIAPKDYFLLNDESQYYLHNNILRTMIGIDLNKLETRQQAGQLLLEQIDSPQIIQFLLKNLHRQKESHRFEWRINVRVLYDNLDEIIRGVNARWFDDRIPITNYPVLFIKGAHSNYILPEDFPSIRRIYPEAEIVQIPNAGHWLHAEQPQAFMEVVWSFVKKAV